MSLAILPGRVGKVALDGLDQALVLIRGNQPHPSEPAIDQRAKQLAPTRLTFGGSHGHGQQVPIVLTDPLLDTT